MAFSDGPRRLRTELRDGGSRGVSCGEPSKLLKTLDTWRKGWDSNPRGSVNPLAVFKTAALNRSATLPCQEDQTLSDIRTADTLATGAPLGLTWAKSPSASQDALRHCTDHRGRGGARLPHH